MHSEHNEHLPPALPMSACLIIAAVCVLAVALLHVQW